MLIENQNPSLQVLSKIFGDDASNAGNTDNGHLRSNRPEQSIEL